MRQGIDVFHPFPSSFVFMPFCTVNLTLRVSKVRILCSLFLYDMIPPKKLRFIHCRHYFLSSFGVLMVLLRMIPYTHPTPKSQYLPSTARNLTESEQNFVLLSCCYLYVAQEWSPGNFAYFSGIYYYVPFYDRQESLSISLQSRKFTRLPFCYYWLQESRNMALRCPPVA
jgi:hypothetical protein